MGDQGKQKFDEEKGSEKVGNAIPIILIYVCIGFGLMEVVAIFKKLVRDVIRDIWATDSSKLCSKDRLQLCGFSFMVESDIINGFHITNTMTYDSSEQYHKTDSLSRCPCCSVVYL